MLKHSLYFVLRQFIFIFALSCSLSVGATETSECENNQDKELCYYWKADEHLDPSLCDYTTDKRDACLSNLASKTSDINLCKKIKDNNNWHHSNCHYEVALKEGKKELCDAVRNNITPYALCKSGSFDSYSHCERFNYKLPFQSVCKLEVENLNQQARSKKDYENMKRWFFIAECELKVGTVQYDDYYLSKRHICYDEKAAAGDYKACLKSGEVGCLVGNSLNKKEYLCGSLDNNYIKNICIKRLFNFDDPSRWNIHDLKDIESIRHEHNYSVTNLDDIAETIAQTKEQVRHLGYRLEKLDLTRCNGLTIFYRLTGDGVNHKVGDPIYYLKSCLKTPKGYEGTIATYQ